MTLLLVYRNLKSSKFVAKNGSKRDDLLQVFNELSLTKQLCEFAFSEDMSQV